MKVVKITLIALLSLAIAVVLAWGVLYYLIWPKPEIIKLVPGAPLAYVTAANLGETLPAAEESEFVKRIAMSPLWKDFESSRLWQQMRLQKRVWERQAGAQVDPDGIVKLVEKDALLAFYGGRRPWSFLLISEVGVVTRINITSGSTERMLVSRYKFTTEKYRGIQLKTLAVPSLEFSYGFIGRAGLLSTDKSLLKKTVDLYRSNGQGLAATSGFKAIAADLPRSDVSFYVDAAKLREIIELSLNSSLGTGARVDPRLSYVASVSRHINAWAGAGFRQNGKLRLDIRAKHASDGKSPHPPFQRRNKGVVTLFQRGELENDISARHRSDHGGSSDGKPLVPSNCLFFVWDKELKPDFLFEVLKMGMRHSAPLRSLDLDSVRDRLLPVLHNGAAVTFLEPNVAELQLLPPVMIFFWVKDGAAARAALEDVKGSLKIEGRKLKFTEKRHENVPISHTRLPIGMGMSLDAGYAFIGSDLLAIATDTSALKAAIDVSLSKRRSLMEDEQYAGVLTPIVNVGTDSRSARAGAQLFANIRSIAKMTKQAAKLYAWRAKIAGERDAERIATMLYQNAFTLEAWHVMGAAFDSDSGETNVKMMVSSE